MNPHLSLSPFGQRPLSLALMASEAAASSCPSDKIVQKWTVYRTICEAKDLIGVSDRALAVLSALLSFHPDTTLQAGNLVVFPSNRELALRAHGMAPATLRRHLSLLVNCGLIVRRDSPNGKRYARKAVSGDVERAFGFDLAPLVLRAEEFQALADEVRAERRKISLLREEISIYRRDIIKMILIGLEEDIEADWAGLQEQARLLSSLRPGLDGTELEPKAAGLAQLREEVRNLFHSLENQQKMSANESQTERLYLNSKTEPQIESEPASENAGPNGRGSSERVSPAVASYPLVMVLKACPDIADYARSGIRTWNDLVDAANLVRPMLGISPSAYGDAVRLLGSENAAVTIAAILQKGEDVRNPGGYLRALNQKAEQGKFTLGPVLMALLAKRGSPGLSEEAGYRVRLE